MAKLFPFLGKKKKKMEVTPDEPDMEISGPTEFKHNWHVGFNAETGDFEGLPGPWESWLQTSNIRYCHLVSQLSVRMYRNFIFSEITRKPQIL